jgi:hypothetical protein
MMIYMGKIDVTAAGHLMHRISAVAAISWSSAASVQLGGGGKDIKSAYVAYKHGRFIPGARGPKRLSQQT